MKQIDWSKVKSGDRFTARIRGVKCEGKIEKSQHNRLIYLCQNLIMGAVTPNNHGYKYSWCIIKGTPEDLSHPFIDVTNLKINSKTYGKETSNPQKSSKNI